MMGITRSVSYQRSSRVSKPLLHRGTLDQYLVAPEDAKIGLRVNKGYNWRQPDTISRRPCGEPLYQKIQIIVDSVLYWEVKKKLFHTSFHICAIFATQSRNWSETMFFFNVYIEKHLLSFYSDFAIPENFFYENLSYDEHLCDVIST